MIYNLDFLLMNVHDQIIVGEKLRLGLLKSASLKLRCAGALKPIMT
jgi:hypothetical protein